MTDKKETLYQQMLNDCRQYIAQGLQPEADLHIHTTFSDGLFTPAELIKYAKEIHLKRIYFTDHNTILPTYLNVKSLPRERFNGIQVGVGTEIACKILDEATKKYIPIEILAYGVDVCKMQHFLDQFSFSKTTSQKEQLDYLVTICKRLGLQTSDEIFLPEGKFATEFLCRDLQKYPENKAYFLQNAPEPWDSPKLFFKKYCANPHSDFYIDTTTHLPTFEETAQAILEAGGLPFLAHAFIYIYQDMASVYQMLEKIEKATNYQVNIEVFHSSHTKEHQDFLLEYAKANHLLISGGTDFHSGPDTVLGFGKKGNLQDLKLSMFPWLS